MFEKITLHSKHPGPRVCIVGCVHGDEPIGALCICALKKAKILKGSLSLIIAHPRALKKKKRFIQEDLNRSFGTRKRSFERKLARELSRELNLHDVVLDIHATNSAFKDLIITTDIGKKHRNLMKLVPIEKVMYAPAKVFGGHELIAHTPLGIALEYGPDKTGKNFTLALSHIRAVLASFGMIASRSRIYPRKKLYTLSGAYRVPHGFKPSPKLRDFLRIRKGQHIGSISSRPLKAEYDFFPIFLGKGRYKGTLALTARKVRSIRL